MIYNPNIYADLLSCFNWCCSWIWSYWKLVVNMTKFLLHMGRILEGKDWNSVVEKLHLKFFVKLTTFCPEFLTFLSKKFTMSSPFLTKCHFWQLLMKLPLASFSLTLFNPKYELPLIKDPAKGFVWNSILPNCLQVLYNPFGLLIVNFDKFNCLSSPWCAERHFWQLFKLPLVSLRF